MSSVTQNVLKFYQQLTGEERRIPLIFDEFHFCRSRVIGLDITENRIFTLSYDNLSIVSQNVLKFYQQLTDEERRIPLIFDEFHFCRSRVIGLDMTENMIFTLCRMIILFIFLLSTEPEIVVPGSGIRFRYLIFENSGKMTNYAVFLPSLLPISTKS